MSKTQKTVAVVISLWLSAFFRTGQAAAASLFDSSPSIPNSQRGGPRGAPAPGEVRHFLDPEALLPKPEEVPTFAWPWNHGAGNDESMVWTATTTARAPKTAGIAPIPLNGCPSSDYAAPIMVGGQNFYAIVDTGSGNLGLASDLCATCNVNGYHLAGLDLHERVSASYGSGAWVGSAIHDYVRLGSGPVSAVTLASISSARGFFQPDMCILGSNGPTNHQGIMGLGPNSLLDAPLTSYVSSVLGRLRYPGISFSLCDNGGFMYLGGVPRDAITAEPFWTPMVHPQYSPFYAVLANGISLNQKDTGITVQQLGVSIVDTGTTAMVFPTEVHGQLVQQIEQASNGFVPAWFLNQHERCVPLSPGVTATTIDARAPALTLSFFNAKDPEHPWQLTSPATQSYISVQPAVNGLLYACPMLTPAGKHAQTILGNAFMRGFNLAFDLHSWSLGFAPSNVCGTPS